MFKKIYKKYEYKKSNIKTTLCHACNHNIPLDEYFNHKDTWSSLKFTLKYQKNFQVWIIITILVILALLIHLLNQIVTLTPSDRGKKMKMIYLNLEKRGPRNGKKLIDEYNYKISNGNIYI